MDLFVKEHQDKIKNIMKKYKECNECKDLKNKNGFKLFPIRLNYILNFEDDEYTEIQPKSICKDCYNIKEKERYIDFQQLLDNINEIQIIYKIMKNVKEYQKIYLETCDLKVCEICKDSNDRFCYCETICQECDDFLYSRESCDPTCYKCSEDYHMKKVHCYKCKYPLSKCKGCWWK